MLGTNTMVMPVVMPGMESGTSTFATTWYTFCLLYTSMVNYLFDEDDEEVVFVRQELDEAPAALRRRADVRRREVIADGQFIVGYRVQNAK